MLKPLFGLSFFICMLLTSIIHFPLLLIRPMDPKNTGAFLHIFNFLAKILLPIRFHVTGHDYIKNHTPSIMISNHQSNFDMIWASYGIKNKVVALGKWEIIFFPIFGLNFLLSGNILIKRGNSQSREKAMVKIRQRLIEKDVSIIIFPEGHRNQQQTLLPFKKGAFKLAKELELPIVVLVIEPYVKGILAKKDFNMHYFNPIKKEEVARLSLEDLEAKCRKMIQTRVDSFNS